MPLFESITDRFWNYVSPRKTQERRDKPFKTPALPPVTVQHRKTGASSTKSGRMSMSPRSRVQSWKMATGEFVRPADHRAPFATPSIGGATPPHDSIDMDLEGVTLMDDIEEEDLKDYSAQYDANDETMVDEEYNLKEEVVFDLEEERRKWAVKAEEMHGEGWSKDAVDIYIRIGMRGHEPLLPASWAFDFRTLPSTMFSTDPSEAFIKSVQESDFRGIKATSDLLFLGRNVRDARYYPDPSRTSHTVAKRALKAYYKWATEDASVTGPSDIPTLVIEAGGVNVPAAVMQHNMTRRLHKLANRYRDALRVHPSTEPEDSEMSANPPSEAEYTAPLPTLYGIIASHTVLAFVCYEPSDDEAGLRMIGVFDFGEPHTDVWNSLAVAQFIVQARNSMMAMQPYTKHDLDDGTMEEDDPDA
ncbi:hypothetical protein EJ05DRAFT_479355 [Pseudovirgaria hyperparasitica]|uniref:Uncharacterized protein n=1 Tax=Pseudovirgaria hyperparasitica TaxID=470096 RepID=A0A6A6VYH9_9PEZI|nr:uncharacterized protein EJ05DRAFT_479355 [Pseudovirgaria hyperparasitica]KAF2754357.1 hypothetical protein EJ05DRAFT_479355 [Pseudovirgaria hyperparasitica]